MFTRDESLTFLREHNKEEMHIRHAYAVEAAMRGFAKHFGEDEDYWGLIGLMHDIDWEEFPSTDTHPMVIRRILFMRSWLTVGSIPG